MHARWQSNLPCKQYDYSAADDDTDDCGDDGGAVVSGENNVDDNCDNG